MLGGASGLFPECYKYKNIEKSEILIKNVISIVVITDSFKSI